VATVLVVDDRASNRELARTLLGYRGHDVIEANEGAAALNLAHTRHPDLVLTDILMPGMDGYELARELRASADTAQTPIVFYTANYLEEETRPFAEACGVARVLLKSSDPLEFMDAIDEVLAEERAVAPPIDTADTNREHLHAINAKLVERTQELSDTEGRFRLMADSSPVGIIFGDAHGSANYVNTRLTGIMKAPAEDLLDFGWLACTGQEHHEEIVEAVRGGSDRAFQRAYRSRVHLTCGAERWLTLRLQAAWDDDGKYRGFVGTVDDVTALVVADQQRRDEERQHELDATTRATERLDSLSRLAGGVAHDFNNILGAMLGFESLLTDTITETAATGGLDATTAHAMLSDLEQIRTGGQRAAGLTQQLLAFGRRTIINVAPVDLNQAVREACELLTPTLGNHITLVRQLAPGLLPILAEPTNVAQILLNVILNAGQAMPGGGTLTVATSQLEAAETPEAADPGLSGRFTRLTVHDTGHGMAPEVLERSIEPFFTTKPRGQGVGFGLATVYGIVNQLCGVLRIESEPGAGTLVTIDLPTSDKPVAAPPSVGSPSGGSETILVAEDEDGVRELVVRVLSKAGYAVLAAPCGADALELSETHPGHIDLLLSDIMMPGMLGSELASRLLVERPGTRVLFMSGYAGDLMSDQGALEAGTSVLAKPFSQHELLAAVRSMIDTPRPSA
jgi:PAS domain S-box-containing protein